MGEEIDAGASPRPGGASAALLGGLVAGCLDITYAFVNGALAGRPPLRILQSVASGLTGAGAFKGGVLSGALGLGCHFLIAIGAAFVYFLASRWLSILRTRPWLSGAVFGIGVYLFMNFVVLRLSAVPFKLRYDAGVLAQGFVSHTVLVGWPIALAISGRLRRRR